jgi:hypothetical protein
MDTSIGGSLKVHVAVTAESLQLSIAIGPGDEHGSVRLIEAVDGIKVKMVLVGLRSFTQTPRMIQGV